MRKDLLVIVGFLVAGVFAAYYLFGNNHVGFISARGTVADAAPAQPDNGSSHSDKMPHTANTGKKPLSASTGLKAVTPIAEIPVSRVPSPRVNPACCELPFPTPETLAKGLTEAEIRARFGDPALNVARTDDGRVTERLYYVNGKRTQLTIANLENGRLKSAESQPGGVLPLPKAAGENQ